MLTSSYIFAKVKNDITLSQQLK